MTSDLIRALVSELAGCATRHTLERRVAETVAAFAPTWTVIVRWADDVSDPDLVEVTPPPSTARPSRRKAHDRDVALVRDIIVAAQRSVRVVERVAGASRRGFERSKALEAKLRSGSPFDGITARSDAMREVLRQAEAVADYPTTVLLQGESGTGKEVVARFIHRASRRSPLPFVAMSCAAIPDGLVESMLFGHERGAFTGAATRHAGVFERAGDGTLFLDEIAELPESTQAKLLRVLQERSFETVGGTRPIVAGCRVIAASHQDLGERVNAGRFRADLYYRLHVVPIVIAPLRERREDIEPLAAALLRNLCAAHGRPVPRIASRDLHRLIGYDWPGNVRELSNVLEHALIVSGDGEFRVTLPARSPLRRRADVEPEATTLDEAMRRSIVAALEATHGRIYGPGGAAERLGLRPSTLQFRMKKLDIERADFVARRARQAR